MSPAKQGFPASVAHTRSRIPCPVSTGQGAVFPNKAKGFLSSKDLPLLIFPCKLVANWCQLLNALTEPVLDALHMLFPPRSAGKAKPHCSLHEAQGWIKLIIPHVSFFCL